MNFQSAYKQWIELGRPYSLGIDLLKSLHQSGRKSPLLGLISSKESSFTKGKLDDELKRLLESNQQPVIEEKKYYGAVDTKKFPKDLQELYKSIISNLKSIDFYRGQLTSIFYDQNGKNRKFPDEKTALKLAQTIHGLFLTNLDAWARVDYFKEHGKYLPGTEPKEITVERLIFLLSKQVQVKDYLYKAKKKIEAGKPINQNLFDEYTAIENEINSLIK